MANLYVGTHKTTNKKWRDGWDRTFGKKPITEGRLDWNYHFWHGLKTSKKECPECGGRVIKRNRCQKCGYTPKVKHDNRKIR